MTRNFVTCWASLAVVLMSLADLAIAGSATPDSIIVMPARKRVVQVASNISKCRDVGLVTYNTSPALASPLIHVWNGQEWIQITMDEYVQGSFMSGEPRHVFILGDSAMLPAAMAATPVWGNDVHKIASLDTASLVNEIGQVLKLSPRQWRWLASVNGLTLTDTNVERRRYGRWGAPGEEKEVAPAAGKLETLELPPAPIAETITPVTAPAPKAEVVMPETMDAVPLAEPAVAIPRDEAIKGEPPKVEAPKAAVKVLPPPVPEAPKPVMPAVPAAAPADQ